MKVCVKKPPGNRNIICQSRVHITVHTLIIGSNIKKFVASPEGNNV